MADLVPSPVDPAAVISYRIGWWTHAWWPTRPLLVGLLTGNQLSPRADNGRRFVGRRSFVRPVLSRLWKIRRPHRPWQAEASDVSRFCRRALTAAGAERKMRADAAHVLLHGVPAPWQQRRARKAVRRG